MLTFSNEEIEDVKTLYRTETKKYLNKKNIRPEHLQFIHRATIER